MTEEEKIKIKNNFKEYVRKTDNLIYLLFVNSELCKFIIDNNLFWKNIESILVKHGEDRTLEMFKILITNDKEKKFIGEDMYCLFNNLYVDSVFLSSIINIIKIRNIMNVLELKKFLIYLLKEKCTQISFSTIEYLYSSENKDILINNFEDILKKSYSLLDIKQLIKEDKKLMGIYNKHINQNPENLIYEIMVRGFFLELDKVKGEKIFDTIKTIIDELLDHEKINYSDIDFLGIGALNYVISIGNKVLKIGQKREVFNMDNNKRFLKPVLRTEINKINSKEVLGCIEITEKADTTNITEEDLYIVYKELRDNGYRWFDCREANLGKLIRKNKIYFKNLDPVKEAVGYKTDNKEELDKDELVIIDNDYIYTEEEFKNLPQKTRELYFDSSYEYEQKYQEDKRRSK